MRRPKRAFTLIEILVVVIVMTIAARIVIPMVSGGSYQVSLAGRAVMDDLLAAQNMAMVRQRLVYVVVRPVDSGQYPGYDITYAASPTAVADWVTTADRGPWVTRFGKYGAKSADSNSPWVLQTSSVIRGSLGMTTSGALAYTQLTGVTNAGTPPVFSFDAFGQPCDSTGAALATTVVLTITKGNVTRTITIQPLTGEITTN